MVEGLRYSIPDAWRPLDVPRTVLVKPALLWPPEKRWDRVPMWAKARGIQLRDDVEARQHGWGCTQNGVWVALVSMRVTIDRTTEIDLMQFVSRSAIRLPDR